jgi:hypothetical protein
MLTERMTVNDSISKKPILLKALNSSNITNSIPNSNSSAPVSFNASSLGVSTIGSWDDTEQVRSFNSRTMI